MNTLNPLLVSILILISQVASFSQTKIYPIDSWHSNIQFTVKFGDIVDVQGTFNEFEGAITFSDQDPLQLSATVIIDVKSIDTNVDLRDTHLKGDEYFGAEKFPQIKFVSDHITKRKGDYFLNGVIEMRGVKKNIAIQYQQLSSEKLDPWKNPRVTFSGKTTLNRKDFQIAPSNTSISDEVTISLTISARIFGMETQGIFKRPFGEMVWNKFKSDGVEAALLTADELFTKDDADAKRSLSLNFVAMRMEEENQNDQALKVYEYNAKRFPDKDVVHSNLANAYFRKNLKEKAIESSRKALEIYNGNAIALEILKFYRVNL